MKKILIDFKVSESDKSKIEIDIKIGPPTQEDIFIEYINMLQIAIQEFNKKLHDHFINGESQNHEPIGLLSKGFL